MGAWATSPVAGAYPVEGKQYYIFAIQKNGSRTYLYNSSNSLALNQGSKENEDAYKWTVTISEGKYIVKNVANTSYYLGVNSVLALTTSSKEWSLGKSVSDPACVSLYYDNNEASEFTGGIYYVTNKSGTTVSTGMYLTSKNGTDSYSTNDNWTASYVFEEVLSAHSLTDGKYYTIYCDNDNKQYLYDNAGTLAQASSAPDSDLKYVWQCIVNGDYYNFRNLQTGKYLGWRALSASAYDYTITTTQAIHDGCATMWGPTAGTTGRNWSIKNDGTLTTGQTTTKDDKVSSIWSTDFRFDEIDLSTWCIGDLLGGSISGTDNWASTWTSGTSPSFTLTATVNDINHKNNRTTGGLDIRSGSGSAGYDTYTITAPTGYLITGYKISGYALNGNQTVTPSKGGDATVFTTAGNSISVSGLHQGKASFKLSGANDGLFIRALQVSLTPIANSTASLPTTNDKAYVIYNARAVWNFVDDATSMNAVALGNIDLDNEEQQIALIYHNENYYLYSVNAGKYLTASNTLTSVVTDNEQISITSTGNATYPWFFKFKNVADKNINIDGNPTVRINSTSALDDGNQNSIVEVADFDATEALAMFDNRYITYNLSYGGNDTFRTKSDVVVAPDGDPADYVPDSWKAAYCTLTYDVDIIEESTTEVNVTATWNGPFDFSSDIEHPVWYYITIGSKWVKFVASGDYPLSDEIQTEDAGLWAFVGNPIDGVECYNKSAGNSVKLNMNSGLPMSESGFTVCTITRIDANSLYLTNEGYGPRSNGSKMVLGNGDEATHISPITFRSYYCQRLIDDIYDWADDNHRDEYFGPSETSLTTLTNNVSTYFPKMSQATYEGYTLPDDILNDIVPKYPTTGYYRIKNNGTGDYIAYGQPVAAYNDKDPGLIAISSDDAATDASSIIKLTGSGGTYKLSTEGLNVQSQTTGNQAFPATSSAGVDFVFTSANKNCIVSITNAASRVDDNKDGSLHNATGWTVNGIVNWSASADNSKWVIEDAESITLTLNSVDGKTYGTTYLPFGVTLPTGEDAGNDVYAYTLTDNDNGWLTLNLLGTDGKSIPANTPVLLRGTSTTSVTATIADVDAIDTGSNALSGTCVSIEHGDNLVLGKIDNVVGFYKYNFDIKANKAYIDGSAGVKGFKLMLDDDDATSIASLLGETEEGGSIYNLAGQRLNKMQKGINIVNGKKILK